MYKTMEQIEREFDGQWVVIGNYQEGEYGSIIGGEVIAHGKDEGEVIKHWKGYGNPKRGSYFRYVGQPPEGVSYLL